jgi:flagellar hook-basal body complex protein FliE
MNPISIIGGIAQSGALSSIADAISGNAQAAAPAGATSFLDALGDVAGKVVDTLKHSESLSLQALGGADVNAREVADAVMSAEQSLQAAIAIRDKIVTAYLEVSRMAI